jgi:hypothetical protein
MNRIVDRTGDESSPKRCARNDPTRSAPGVAVPYAPWMRSFFLWVRLDWE